MYFSLSDKSTLATSLMINILTPNSGFDYVELLWTQPLYLPFKYKLTFSCKCTLENVTHNYIVPEGVHLSSNCSSFRVSSLFLESECSLRLLAVYNPASIDPGVTTTVATLGRTDCK